MDILPLEHDARTKQNIKNALFAYLYDPVEKQFKTRLDTLIVRNTVMGGHSHKHFIYKGVIYNADAAAMPVRKNRLAPQLRPLMDEYLADKAHLNNNELPFVLGFINQVLNASNDLTDYLRVMPESIHQPLRQMMATCPCRATHLSEEKVEDLVKKNHQHIQLMKQRMVINLLI